MAKTRTATAIDLINEFGISVYEASKRAGLSPSAVYVALSSQRYLDSFHREVITPENREKLRTSFEKKFRVTPGCWIWTGTKGPKKYGIFSACGKNHVASRISYEMYKTTIPKGNVIMHMCDNPSCVNPDHLQSGTHSDNANDKVSKNRHAYGEFSPSAKLNDEKVRAIRADPRHYTVIALDYDVAAPTIRAVQLRKSWSHLK